MAATPRFKIVNPQGEYVASCVHLEDASFLVAALGDKTKVYDGVVRKVTLLWTEGAEVISAGESADLFRDICERRIATFLAESLKRAPLRSESGHPMRTDPLVRS